MKNIYAKNGILSSTEYTFGYAREMALQAVDSFVWLGKLPPKFLILGGGLGRMTWALQGACLLRGLPAEIDVVECDKEMTDNMLPPMQIINNGKLIHDVTLFNVTAEEHLSHCYPQQYDVILYDLFTREGGLSAHCSKNLLKSCMSVGRLILMNIIQPGDKFWLIMGYDAHILWGENENKLGNSILRIWGEL